MGVAEVRSRSPQKPTSSRPDLTSRVNIPSINLPSTTYMSIVGIAGTHYFDDIFVCNHVFQAHILPPIAMHTIPSEADQTIVEDCWLCTTATFEEHTKWSNEERDKSVE